eukprot:3013575-Rhodomonas_salina.2
MILIHACYEIPGTDRAYAPTREFCTDGVCCYQLMLAVTHQDAKAVQVYSVAAYARPRPCPVLTERLDWD